MFLERKLMNKKIWDAPVASKKVVKMSQIGASRGLELGLEG